MRNQKGQFIKGTIPWSKGKSLSKETRQKLREINTGKKHSSEIKEKLSIMAKEKGWGKWMKNRTPAFILQGKHFQHPKGRKHPFWKGGVTPLNFNIRHSDKYKEWRRKVFIRDKFTCQKCGHRFINIIAHHIKYFSEYKELWFELDNGMTLCRGCHMKFHKPSKKISEPV